MICQLKMDEDIINETLDDRQPSSEEFDDFRNKMSEFIKLDDQIKKLMIAIRERKRAQTVLNSYIREFMFKFNYHDVNFDNCKIKARKKEVLAPIRVSEIKTKLIEYKDMKGEELVEVIFNNPNREKKTKETLQRVIPRISNLSL